MRRSLTHRLTALLNAIYQISPAQLSTFGQLAWEPIPIVRPPTLRPNGCNLKQKFKACKLTKVEF